MFTLFKANTKEATKEVARPKAAPPLLWWRPTAATFVLALNSVNFVAVTTILVLHVCVIGHHVPCRYDFMLSRPSYHARPRNNPTGRPCAQARTKREHEVLMARNMMSNHTDMQDKYCGHRYDIHPIQSQYTKVAAVGRHHKRGVAADGFE